MLLISELTPTNLLEEKEKFFTNTSYNPQFSYNRSFSKEELEFHGLPKKQLYEHALFMINTHNLSSKKTKKPLDQNYIIEECNSLFSDLKLEPIPVTFSKKAVSKAMINDAGLHFKDPLTISKEQFKMTIDHEIQSHWLRKRNLLLLQEEFKIHENQEIKDFRLTEEGIANLHSYVSPENKIMRKTYINYVGAYLGYQYSFVEAFQKLSEIGIHDDLAWNIIVKKKRGLTDTSQVGGYTKDIVYLEGAIAVWKWIMNPANDPHDLYLGRISLSQIPEFINSKSKSEMTYPLFFSDMSVYTKNIAEIGETNHFESLL